ncbi:MAG: asparaginase domain-containing protein [Lachnospira sp.]
MNINVIFTGGTIGSRINTDNKICVDGSYVYSLISMYKSIVPSCDDKFITSQPYTILSENLCADNIKLLIGEISSIINTSSPDAIIITHGTDTIQYSAAIISYLFDCVNIPIVLVSSDYPLEDKRANGLINFHFALKFIHECTCCGVFVSYCNKGDFPVIHRGTRLNQPITLSGDLNSVKDSYVVKYVFEGDDVRACWHDNIPDLENDEEQVKTDDAPCRLCAPDKMVLKDNSDILRIVPYVGMKYPDIPDNTKVILHESYHSGTIAISNELSSFANEANHRGIPIFLTGLSAYENEYETVEQYKKLGIVNIPDSSVISQYCKLWILTSNYEDINEIKRIMNYPVAHDWV